MIRNELTKIGAGVWRPAIEQAAAASVLRRITARHAHTATRCLDQSAVTGTVWRVLASPLRQEAPWAPAQVRTIRTIPTSGGAACVLSDIGARLAWSGATQSEAVTTLASRAWRRAAHHKARRKFHTSPMLRKDNTEKASKSELTGTAPQAELSPTNSEGKSIGKETAKASAASASKSIFDRLPQIPQNLHRPSKEDLLAAATGFWSRLQARFKWFTIRSGRKFNVDEITALFSWILLGHVVWIIIGTTTFVSLAILVINTVFAQETLAQWVGNQLTKSTGLRIVFESAVVPNWKDGKISFKRVFISRRPGGKTKLSKGSQAEAAAAAANAALEKRPTEGTSDEVDDGNYTQFDLSIDHVDVTLSFAKWFNGKGLLKDVDLGGVRGVIDRTSVKPMAKPQDPKSYRREHNYGDIELDSFKMSDLLVTIYQPRNFRPYTVSIYTCDLPQLRKQWLFYDFLSANTISGSFDNSLFTIHPRQSHNYTGMQLEEGAQWKKHSRIRIDGLNLDHLNRGVQGPFGWIHEGNVDIIADLLLPADDDDSIAKVMSDFYDRMEATVTASPNAPVVLQHSRLDEQAVHKPTDADTIDNGGIAEYQQQLDSANAVPEARTAQEDEDAKRFLIMDIRVHLNDVRAAVPLFTNDISYVNNALIRPIVAYINSKRSFIPVNCRVVKQIKDFDGSWTLYDSGLMDDLSQEMYIAFARDVINDKQNRKRRFRKVGVWTIQLAAQALFLGLAGNVA